MNVLSHDLTRWKKPARLYFPYSLLRLKNSSGLQCCRILWYQMHLEQQFHRWRSWSSLILISFSNFYILKIATTYVTGQSEYRKDYCIKYNWYSFTEQGNKENKLLTGLGKNISLQVRTGNTGLLQVLYLLPNTNWILPLPCGHQGHGDPEVYITKTEGFWVNYEREMNVTALLVIMPTQRSSMYSFHLFWPRWAPNTIPPLWAKWR